VNKEAAVEPATIDRIQRMIDGEATERFPADAAPRLALLHYGDHPEIEPGEPYLQVILPRPGASWSPPAPRRRPAYAELRERARTGRAQGQVLTAPAVSG